MESNNITLIVSVICWIIVCGIPLWYITTFIKLKRKKKNYAKALWITIVMFLVLLGIKCMWMIDIDTFRIPNCYINNICKNSTEDKEEDDNQVTSTTKVTTTTEKTTTTAKVLDEKYKKLSVPSGNKENVGTSTNGFEIYTVNGATYIDGYLMVNKSYFLPSDFIPQDTYKSAEGVTKTCNNCINNTAYSAWKDMLADASAIGLNIWIQSGYRPYSSQVTIYNNYVARDGKEKADTYSARPGASEHQSGLCFDLNSITDAFGNTNEGKWVNDHAWEYGFIIRFPKGKQDITGYKYESWHLRYVGSDLAKKLYNNGEWLSMEEYFGISSSYSE